MVIKNLKERPEYIPQLALWFNTAWGHYLNSSLADEEKLLHSYTQQHSFVPTTWVAETGGLLGSSSIVERDMGTEYDFGPWLACVYVGEEHRRQGIGETLVRHVMRQAALNGIETLYLFTPDQQKFYAQMGWQTWKDVVYHGEPVTIMSCSPCEIYNDK